MESEYAVFFKNHKIMELMIQMKYRSWWFDLTLVQNPPKTDCHYLIGTGYKTIFEYHIIM